MEPIAPRLPMSSDLILPAGSSPRRSTPIEPAEARLRAGLHDLGNLMQMVLASAEFGLEAGTSPEDMRETLLCCRSAARRSVDLLRSVMNPSAKSGMAEEPTEALELRGPIEDALKLIRNASSRSLHLVFEGTHDGIFARVEQELLHRSMMNLLCNAAEAVAESGEIRVRLGRGERDSAVIEVIDNGPGMDEETLRQATSWGFSRRGKGRGVGLAFVREFAESVGGELRLSSELGVGTRVRLVLPALRNTERQR